MIDTLQNAFVSAIISKKTEVALAFLNEHKEAILDPLQGSQLHARFLYIVLQYQNDEILKFLLDLPQHSDIAFYHYCGDTPLAFALEHHYDRALPWLLSKTNKEFALHMAYHFNNQKVKELLLKTFSFSERFLKMLQSKSLSSS